MGLRTGFAVSEEIGFQLRYNIYRQEISLPDYLRNCNDINPNWINTFPTPTTYGTTNVYPGGAGTINMTCYADGEASLAVRKELAQGPVLVSMIGYGVSYNTLDNNRNPTTGLAVDFKQDFAGIGGDVNFIRSTVEARTYYELFSDFVAVLKLQGGHIAGWGGKELRMLDHFQMGPNLVRGFAPAGLGPRDITAGKRNRRSISFPRISASRARCSRMSARFGAIKVRRLGCLPNPAPPARRSPWAAMR
jgi:outer membrane protein insertion porin family